LAEFLDRCGLKSDITQSEADLKNATFPRWAGPVVGAVAGALIAARMARRQGQGFSPTWIASGAAIGVVGGLFVWLLDKPRAQPQVEPALGATQATGAGIQTSATLLGRFFAVLAVLLSLAPFVGLILGGVAWFLNRNVRGWPKAASMIGTIIAALFTVLVIIVLMANPGAH
jgi:hypothetical protein